LKLAITHPLLILFTHRAFFPRIIHPHRSTVSASSLRPHLQPIPKRSGSKGEETYRESSRGILCAEATLRGNWKRWSLK
jgi:hypothetical protein